MVRKLRVQYPGAIYHAMNRGDRREANYVHLNPVRAQLVGPEEPLESYRWSSYPVLLSEPGRRPVWLRVDRLLGEWGIPFDTSAGRKEFALRMEARRKAETLDDYDGKGWCSGSDEFCTTYVRYTKEAYAFHAGLLMPPEITVVSLKRFWSGQITTQQIIETCKQYQPEQVLLNFSDLTPEWGDFLKDYSVVYGDLDSNLYVRKSILSPDAPRMLQN